MHLRKQTFTSHLSCSRSFKYAEHWTRDERLHVLSMKTSMTHVYCRIMRRGCGVPESRQCAEWAELQAGTPVYHHWEGCATASPGPSCMKELFIRAAHPCTKHLQCTNLQNAWCSLMQRAWPAAWHVGVAQRMLVVKRGITCRSVCPAPLTRSSCHASVLCGSPTDQGLWLSHIKKGPQRSTTPHSQCSELQSFFLEIHES